MTATMLLDRATTADLAAILALEASGFAPGGRWSADSWRGELQGGGHCAPAVRLDGVLVGVAAFQRVAEVADLNRVIVEPAERGRGIGRALVEAGLVWAGEQGAARVLLEVACDNEPAIALYRGLGFAEISRRADYYGTGRDALVMQKELIA